MKNKKVYWIIFFDDSQQSGCVRFVFSTKAQAERFVKRECVVGPGRSYTVESFPLRIEPRDDPR